MGLRDRLFGKRPEGLGGIEDRINRLGAAARATSDALGGTRQAVRMCPTCHREAAPGRDICPVGHHVGPE